MNFNTTDAAKGQASRPESLRSELEENMEKAIAGPSFRQ